MLFCHLDFFFFLNKLFQKSSFRNTIRVSNSLDPDQAPHFVGSDLGPNYLQRLSADDKSSIARKELKVDPKSVVSKQTCIYYTCTEK